MISTSAHASSRPLSLHSSLSYDPTYWITSPSPPHAGEEAHLPPHYRSITSPSLVALQAAGPGAGAQTDRNREKQAIRDAQRRQDEERLRSQRAGLALLRGQPPPSVEPSQRSRSQSDPSDNRVELGHCLSAEDLKGEEETSPRARQAATRRGQAGTQGQRGGSAAALAAEDILPRGMSVKDALAKCEDPTLGWSLHFWITIADPITQHVFFANPATGQTSWHPPQGVFIVPRQAEGEWWELADTTRGNRSYFYNTMTQRTQWTRPGGEAFVIPLGLIQRNTLPERSANASHLTPNRPEASTSARESRQTTSPSSRQSGPRPPLSPRVSQTRPPTAAPSPATSLQANPTGSAPFDDQTSSSWSPRSPPLSSSSINRIQSPLLVPSPSPQMALGAGLPLTVVDEGSGNETDLSDNPGKAKRSSRGVFSNKWRKDKDKDKDKGKGKVRERAVQEEAEADSAEYTSSPETNGFTNGSPVNVRIGNGPDLPRQPATEPIPIEKSVRTKRLSTGLHPLLPSDISNEIQNFQAEDFASKYFATRRTGMLRQRVPLEQLMEWQRAFITAPVLMHSKNLAKEATTTFKIIQHVMGERSRPVEGVKSVQSSSSHLSLAGIVLGGRKEEEALEPGARNGKVGNVYANGPHQGSSNKMVVLEEVRWMIQLGVIVVEMRDEVYCQVIKQLTKNPDHDATVLGFQLLCVLVNAFGPGKDFSIFVKSFLQKHLGQTTDGVGIMSKYCLNKLQLIAAKGGRTKVLTVGEIEHASDAAFYPSVYGESLDRIMDLQKRSYPALKVPVILPFLADGILGMGGTSSEGIFRIPGDADSISELKSRMDRGHYQLKDINDPHVAASLFKLWLRELEEPIIPQDLYNDALAASATPEQAIAFVSRLPIYNRRVLLFVISFLQLFIVARVVEATKMTPNNLALVMAPNILRTTSNHLVTVFTNSSFESKFLLQLLEHMRPAEVDPDYVPSHVVGGSG